MSMESVAGSTCNGHGAAAYLPAWALPPTAEGSINYGTFFDIPRIGIAHSVG